LHDACTGRGAYQPDRAMTLCMEDALAEGSPTSLGCGVLIAAANFAECPF
jgi:hypothetical protein